MAYMQVFPPFPDAVFPAPMLDHSSQVFARVTPFLLQSREYLGALRSGLP
jgi:hypothetical protein